MKNHIQVNGQIININKKMSDLSMKQRKWIAETLRTETLIFLEQNNGNMNKQEKEVIVDLVYEKIEERKIWIPYNEVKKYADKKITEYKRRFEK